MKRLAFLMTLLVVCCTPKQSLESQAIKNMCDDNVADSCIVMLPRDTTTTHFVKAAFGDNGLYYLSDLPLSEPRMRIWIDNGIRTRYFSDFEYMGQFEGLYIYALPYNGFPNIGRYEFDLIRDCDLYYYNGIGGMFAWNMTYYPDAEDVLPEESFNKWFQKAIPYMLK